MREDASPGVRRTLLLATTFIAGLGFAYKYMEFAKTWIEGELLGFAVVPLLMYVMVSAGFACLLFWALFGGQFRPENDPSELMIRRELDGDDPIPAPFDDQALGPGARLVGRVVAAATVTVMGYLFYLMFAPANPPVELARAPVTMEVQR